MDEATLDKLESSIKRLTPDQIADCLVEIAMRLPEWYKAHDDYNRGYRIGQIAVMETITRSLDYQVRQEQRS